jgi:hypothetical protein
MSAQTIGVVGLGYVGLPLAVAFAEAGDSVVALDTDIRKIAAIHRGDSLHRRHLKRAPAGGPHRRDDPLRQAREGRRRHHLRADTPLATASQTWGRCSQPPAACGMFYRPGGWSCSNRPRSPAPRAIISCRSWRSRGSRWGSTSTLHSHPNAWTPVGPTTRCAAPPPNASRSSFPGACRSDRPHGRPLLALGIIVLYVIGLTMPGARSPEVGEVRRRL